MTICTARERIGTYNGTARVQPRRFGADDPQSCAAGRVLIEGPAVEPSSACQANTSAATLPTTDLLRRRPVVSGAASPRCGLAESPRGSGTSGNFSCHPAAARPAAAALALTRPSLGSDQTDHVPRDELDPRVHGHQLRTAPGRLVEAAAIAASPVGEPSTPTIDSPAHGRRSRHRCDRRITATGQRPCATSATRWSRRSMPGTRRCPGSPPTRSRAPALWPMQRRHTRRPTPGRPPPSPATGAAADLGGGGRPAVPPGRLQLVEVALRRSDAPGAGQGEVVGVHQAQRQARAGAGPRPERGVSGRTSTRSTPRRSVCRRRAGLRDTLGPSGRGGRTAGRSARTVEASPPTVGRSPRRVRVGPRPGTIRARSRRWRPRRA
jgi:hypothetical protein